MKQGIPSERVVMLCGFLAIWVLSFLFLYHYPTAITTKIAPKVPVSAISDPPPSHPPSPPPSPPPCDASRGEWVRDPDAPYYTNATCWTIQEHQNCMKHGRPDSDFLKWRWRPDDGCELRRFEPQGFLEAMRGRRMAFVGDSLARNHMQSLMCLLSRVDYPKDVSDTADENFKRMLYVSHNFTVSSFWSPFLVKAEEGDLPGLNWTGLWNLYLDEPDDRWTIVIEDFDYLIISGGNWFTRPSIFFEGRRIVGSNYHLKDNITTLDMYYGHKRAFRTALRAINKSKGFRGTTVLRTVSPSHFEGGEWNSGGDCNRTKPFGRKETRLGAMDATLYGDQMSEFLKAKRAGKKKGLEFRLLDSTQAMLLRPDGHPSRYGNPDWARARASMVMPNDCVHWCLPGPVDMWNDLLFHVLQL